MNEVDVRDFIVNNYTPYDGDDSFLTSPTDNTKKLWDEILDLYKKENENGGILDMDTSIVTSITSHNAGYIDKEIEQIVGLQTNKPLKRALFVYGGFRLSKRILKHYGYKMDENIKEFFSKHRKTHNEGVFDVYTDEIRRCRHSHILTGLPDAYGRGRIIGDYRRVALYGIDHLIEDKVIQKKSLSHIMDEDNIRLSEELSEQINALNELKQLGLMYGYDLSKPATNTKEAIQWLYFAYLGAVKEQNGAAMSLGRISTFLDIFAERDLKLGIFSEQQIQEFVDHLVMKLRIIRFARSAEYNELFTGDPVWITECIGGIGLDGRHMVTKMSFRFLHTLTNLKAAPEPNLTVLWSVNLPINFKNYCAKMSMLTSSIQYENDDLMRPVRGDDYAIACCVSSMRLGKEMQFFGARTNLAKCLLYGINGGVDEVHKDQVGPEFERVEGEYLDYEDVKDKFFNMMDWLCGVYVNALNIIHYMHDKYSYERLQMALHDKKVTRWFATGIAGISVVADSLSAIKYAKVKAIRDKDGIVVDYDVEGDFPKYGNDDDRVDDIAKEVINRFITSVKKHKTYRNSIPTLSLLTITSNVVYGKNTGNTPDGRKYGEAFAPGANPMHNRDCCGAVASLASVAKIPYEDALDGISNTFSVVPEALGPDDDYILECYRNNIVPKVALMKQSPVQIKALVNLLDGYARKGGHHLNINVFNKFTLIDAQKRPEIYPQLTIRVSGYAVNFHKLTKEQQDEVISRTFHEGV